MAEIQVFDLPTWPPKGQRRKLEQQWIELIERDGLPEGWLESPSQIPQELFKAVDEYNEGQYWECHETLEEVWLGTSYPLRFFYHAIIKAAVGFHHLYRRNHHGARVKMSDSLRLLPFFQPTFMDVRTDEMFDQVSAWVGRLDRDVVDWDELHALPSPTIHLASSFRGSR